jgi:glycosyltransferase involved in cell wall biosynthesis
MEGKTVQSGSGLRIAMISTPWYPLPPPAYGGIEAMCAGLVDTLVERGHEITVIGVGPPGTAGQYLATNDKPEWKRLGHVGPEVLHAARTARLLEGLDVDIVHDHSTAGPLQAGQRTVPTVVTAHGSVGGENGQYYGEIDDTVSLVAISRAQREQAPNLSWAGLVHNAVRTTDFPYAGRKQNHVVFLGRLSPEKGAHLAIRAAREAGFPIILAGPCGSQADQRYFDDRVRPLLGTDARWIGEVDFAAKVDLLANARCMVFPIEWEEPFGMVMIEAMACGTPVVALRRGSVPEIIADGVTGFIRDRPEELAEAIRDTEGLRPADCRRRVRRSFDVGRMAAGYEAIYRRLALRRAVHFESMPGLDQASLDQAALETAALEPGTLDPAVLDPGALDPAALESATLEPARLPSLSSG